MHATALVEIGGLDALRIEYMSSIPNSTLYGSSPCGIPQESAWHIFRPANDPDYPWPGVMFGITLLSAYFFCTNQVQKYFMYSKNYWEKLYQVSVPIQAYDFE